jgi:hypothetical protein
MANPNDPPDIAAARAKTDLDGNGVVNANDFQQFLNYAGIVMSYDAAQQGVVPVAPTSLLAVASGQTVTLNWTDNSNNELGFNVERQGLATLFTTSANVTNLSDQPGVGTWNYRVRSFNNAGASAWTAFTPVTIAAAPTIPAAPSGLNAILNGQTVVLNWSDNSNNETGFNIERQGSPTLLTTAANATTISDNPGVGTWNYRIQSFNAAGTSAWTAYTTVTVVSVPSVGWTDFTLPAGAQAFYVAVSGGSDTNPGTQAAPFATFAKGWSMLRDGQPDQLWLKAGDTFAVNGLTLTKSANSTTKYMVVGSYGNTATNPRAKLRFPGGGFQGNNTAQHNGLAFVGLDMGTTGAQSNNTSGFTFLSTNGASWDDVLIEDCYISGFGTGIVAQTLVDGHAFLNFKIRRSVICDNDYSGSGHAQGVFLGGAKQWVIEDCVIDNNARSKADMFCHNLYCHEWSCPGIFNNNISARACSHGGQMRPGGVALNNLFLNSPINFYMGGNSLQTGNTVNTFKFNVVLDSRDIAPGFERGEGFNLAGASGSVIEYNVAAHQKSGTQDVVAYAINGWSGNSFKNNVEYDWYTPANPGWSTAVQIDGGTGSFVFSGNKLLSPHNGMRVRFDTAFRGTYDHNTYATTTPDGGVGGYQRFSTSAGVGASWAQWQSIAGETGSTFLGSAPVIDASIGAYLTSIGINPGADPVGTFMTNARKQSKVNWDTRFLTSSVNAWVRSKFGVMVNP